MAVISAILPLQNKIKEVIQWLLFYIECELIHIFFVRYLIAVTFLQYLDIIAFEGCDFMKRIYLLLTLILVLTLSACGSKPYEPELDGYEYVELEALYFIHNNGVESRTLFQYDFINKIKVFQNENETTYDFKNINDYVDMSVEIQQFLKEFEGMIAYDSIKLQGFNDTVKLSTGATDKDYNYVEVDIDEDVYDVTAFISAPNGVNIVINYTHFTQGAANIFVPSYIQFDISEIHSEVKWEYFSENNDFHNNEGKVITYNTIVVPTPMKTGSNLPFEDIDDDKHIIIDNFHTFSIDQTGTGSIALCTETVTDNCIESNYTEIDVQIYYMDIDDVYDFYVNNYSGSHDGDNFVFVNDGYTFAIVDLEETEVRLENNELANVVNATIKIYE